jgi:hypothetical protein
MGRSSCPSGCHRCTDRPGHGCYRPAIDAQDGTDDATASTIGRRRPTTAARPTVAAARTGQRTTWWISFVVFGALACLWALTTPLGAGPDEPAHIIKAVAVAHGNFDASVVVEHPGPRYSVPRTTLDVPRAIGALTTARDCYILRPYVPAGCAPSIGSDTTLAPATTEAGAYPPLYYLLVGWPSRFLPPQPAIYAMRMIGALLAAALLASGLTSATQIGRRRLVVTGAALALTPMAIYLTGVVNPNGLEIAGAFCLWLAALDLLARADRTERAPTRLVVRVVVAAGVVASMRPLSPAFLALIVVTIGLAGATRANLRALWSDSRVRAGLAVLGAVVAASVVYVVANRSYDAVMGQTFEDDPSRLELAGRSWARTWSRLSQMIGIFGSLDAALPPAMVTAWVAAVGAFGAVAVVLGRWRERLVMVVALAGCVLLPVAAETVSGLKTGLAWQGRYTLTVAVGAPILAGWIIDRSRRVPRPAAVVIGVVAAVAVAGGQLVGQVRAMNRYVVGLPSGWLDALHRGTWAGPATPTVLLALAAVACAAYGAWLSWLAVSTTGSDEPTPSPSTAGASAGGEVVVDHDAEGREERPGQIDDLVGPEAGAPQAVGSSDALEP